MRSRHGLAFALVLVTTGALIATTWAPMDVQCPVCHTKNSFNSIMSYGTYIYGWPSKFQNIFWPATDGSSLYTCKHCYFTAFLWDYDKLPAAKIAEVRRVLEGISLDAKYEQYTSIPMSKRLVIAEKVYSYSTRTTNSGVGSTASKAITSRARKTRTWQERPELIRSSTPARC